MSKPGANQPNNSSAPDPLDALGVSADALGALGALGGGAEVPDALGTNVESVDVALRASALRDALVARELVSLDVLEDFVHQFTDELTPENGATVVARCWIDPAFRLRFLDDATAASAELGIAGPEGIHMRAVENTSTLHNVIVCTQCSCTAWPLIGLPPDWYKSAPYRSRVVREARRVLAEMGLALAVDVKIQVWDTTGDTRYVVLPQRPIGTESWSEEELRALITRECLIGVAVPQTGLLVD
jgi:nitrile hydratase subunit alpha